MPSQANDREILNPFKIRNSLACVPCRSRHVKCDATKPACVRCQANGKSCYFVKSRRGLRTTALSFSEDQCPRDLPEPMNQHQFDMICSPQAADSSMPASPPMETRPALPQLSAPQGIDFCRQSAMSNVSKSPESHLDMCLDLYYTFFHNAHPYVVPRHHLDILLQTESALLQDLLIVLEFIGSTYTPEGQSLDLKQRSIETMSRITIPLTGFTVQALLLLAVSVHCCNSFDLARGLLDKASSIALEIDMQSNQFATSNSNRDPVLEESWRRTWWGLYVVDGTFEAIRRSPKFALWDILTDVDLPCEESEYASGNIPKSYSISEYNERDFAEDEVSFSSFTYLIDIVRILGSAMGAAGAEFPDSLVDQADARLVNWELHLPEDKKDVLRGEGEIDEPLFHAHMIFNVTKVFLHRPRSRLAHSPIENISKCAPPPPPPEVPRSKQKAYWLSTAKTLDSAERAINLFTLPTLFIKHTPLVVCGVALSILAELSACSYVLQGQQYDAARDRIRLGIGTLKEYGKTWPVGGQTLSEVKTIAREVFAVAASKSKANAVDEAAVNVQPFDLSPSTDIQSYLGEFGDLDFFTFLDIPGQV